MRGPRQFPIVSDSNGVDYWILEIAIESRIPLALLASSNLSCLFNVPIDGFDRGALLTGLVRLFSSGDIESRDSDASEQGHLDRTALQKAFEHPSWESRPFYELTRKGGARWETLARADWKKYTPLVFYERNGIFSNQIDINRADVEGRGQ